MTENILISIFSSQSLSPLDCSLSNVCLISGHSLVVFGVIEPANV